MPWTDGCLDIGNECIDPSEHRQITGSARTHNDCAVLRHGRSSGVEAGESIGDQMNARIQGSRGPVRQRCSLDVFNAVETHVLRIPLVIEFYRRHEPGLVLRTTSGFAGPGASEIGVIGQHDAVEDTTGLALGHRLEQFVPDAPSSAVYDTPI